MPRPNPPPLPASVPGERVHSHLPGFGQVTATVSGQGAPLLLLHSINAAASAAGSGAADTGSGFSAVLSGPRSVGSLVTVTCHQRLVTGLPLVGPMLGDPEVSERFVIRVESLGG